MPDSINRPEVSKVTVSRALVLHLRFRPYGWATFYIDDAQGTLAIESDWGSYSYRWGRGSHLSVEPPDLSRALTDVFGDDHSYVAKKLFPDRWEYDPRATRKAWLDCLIDLRRSGDISRDEAREAWDEIGELDFTDAPPFDEAPDALGSDPWELTKERLRPRFRFLRDVLLPAFVGALRTELASGEAVATELEPGAGKGSVG